MRRGERVGKYRLTSGPVEGGQGAVWFAVDTELGRPVVLKRARLRDTGPGSFDQMLAEARALAKFSHPHVVTLYDAVRTGKDERAAFWLVLEHVQGGSLDVPLKLTPQLAGGIGAQIAGALAALHAKSLVHCDVKPGNIVITEDRTAKLADFGAALRVDSHTTITPNGPLSLTPAFAAPEAIRGAPERASDVFSLGVTLYQLITGTPPLRGPGHAVRLETLSPQLGPLTGVLTAMLQRDPGARPSAAAAQGSLTELTGGPRALAEDHRRELDTLQLAPATRPFTTTSSAGPARPTGAWSRTAPLRRRPLLAAGTAVAAALAVAVPLLLMLNGDGKEAQEDGAAPTTGRPPGAAAFLGDHRTADPCGLLEVRGFDAYEEALPDRDQGNFNRCDLRLQTHGEDVVDIRVEFDEEGLPEQERRRTEGGVTVVELAETSSECERVLKVTESPEEGSVRITAVAREPEKLRQELCETAGIATDFAAGVLDDGGVPRRKADFDDRSLALMDACVLLDQQVLEKDPGVSVGEPEAGFGDWACQWKSTSDMEVDLQFDQGKSPRRPGIDEVRYRGHTAFVEPDREGPRSCHVELVHRTYLGEGQRRGTERVAFTVQRAPEKVDPCKVGKDLAKSAAESLSSA
ncbi:non-specific serine/threonine protein kinase [Streptomyces albus]|uniref:non-specific serine/threonine protein kinase n=1 Tax=Streptomyces albus (strain ATCC 21838 / DSM 41398 / FERM P-419 / JCM 4703 / NBRC 107858) TaxID=1081613 RepID=A0A0B5EKX7_STRA4|nr:non-specific serine/threonine protein kinase [Streptomyces albus]AOU76494.1 non-specific serine/threonine protein kinase [Streptomyces albus]AYN32279.1 non-specific serine/threonine protein kinase [Streptomyces albus]